MPQMAPMYWLILLMFFIGLFILFMIINYFNSNIEINNNNNKNKFLLKSFELPWKW
uniref:ATP synthase F0 subunit 8 n=1 Tax=Neopsylla specialis TaxID=129382 RepID=UPI002410EA8A|nr:ATP synthase F0 subunit 8 [Neopsylla specialis]WEQ92380.1 ATP synthase F0 subunit 8 [Neopsylla specialis]